MRLRCRGLSFLRDTGFGLSEQLCRGILFGYEIDHCRKASRLDLDESACTLATTT